MAHNALEHLTTAFYTMFRRHIVMPIQRTTKNGKPAYQYGPTGAKYVYTAGNRCQPQGCQEEGH